MSAPRLPRHQFAARLVTMLVVAALIGCGTGWTTGHVLVAAVGAALP